MATIYGEQSMDYFRLRCSECQKDVQVQGFGSDGPVPTLEYTCETHGPDRLKLMHHIWGKVAMPRREQGGA